MKAFFTSLLLALLAFAAARPARGARSRAEARAPGADVGVSQPFADARTRRQLARLFTRYLKEDGTGKDELLSAVRRLPYFAAAGKFPERLIEYRQLELGVRLAPDAVRAHVLAQARR